MLIFVCSSQDKVVHHLWNGCLNHLEFKYSTLEARYFLYHCIFLVSLIVLCLCVCRASIKRIRYNKNLNFYRHFLKNIIVVVKKCKEWYISISFVFCCICTHEFIFSGTSSFILCLDYIVQFCNFRLSPYIGRANAYFSFLQKTACRGNTP